DTQTFTSVFSYPMGGLRGTPTVLRRWGDQGLALRTDDGTLYVLDDIQTPPACDLALTKTDDRDPVTINDDIYYRIRVRNQGQTPAEQVIVRDPIPPLTTFQYASHPYGFCYDSLGTMVCTSYYTVAAGDSFEIFVDLRAQATGTVTNTATVSTT